MKKQYTLKHVITIPEGPFRDMLLATGMYTEEPAPQRAQDPLSQYQRCEKVAKIWASKQYMGSTVLLDKMEEIERKFKLSDHMWIELFEQLDIEKQEAR